jgi:membrane-associated phospholipid phosphatase
MSSSRARELAAVGAIAGATFAGVAVATATRASAHVDRQLAPRLALRPRSRGRRVAQSLSPVGKWYTVTSAAVIGGVILARDPRRRLAGATIGASSIVAVLLSKAFDHALPQPPVPANHRHEPRKAVFPSGHGVLATSVASTAAYVLSREALVDPRVASMTAIVFSIANPALKLAVRKHWLSDAVGGVAAGVAIAAACCAAYEQLRDS